MDAVEDIKSRLSIEDVVGDYLELKRSGSNFKALSPFTNEKTPSFMISPEKQIWHDFSSNKGGDMFSFVMEMEGLDFKGALDLLARKAGLDISTYRSGNNKGAAKLKERMYEALDQAANFYQRHLTKHEQALTYVRKKRGFDKETMLEFRIGYSPDAGTELYSYLRSKKFTDEELQKAGLTVVRYNKPSDMFRGRIMVPLMDPQGRIIGFTARLLRDDPNAPKYINTPQTMLYDKSRHVFAFHQAKEAIRKEKVCVMVEGNLDVVSAHQAGTKHVVATAGTALTESHLKTVLHFTDDVRICFDQDDAGQNAIERSIAVASKLGVSLSVLPLPEGKDPDDVIRSDKKDWQTVLQQPVYAMDWLLDRYEKQLDITTAQGKREFTDVVLRRLADIHDPVEREHYITMLARRLDVSPDALRMKLASETATQKQRYHKKPKVDPAKATADEKKSRERAKLRDHLLALGLMQPALRKTVVAIPEEIMEGEAPQKLYKILQEHTDGTTEILTDGSLKGVTDYVKILQLQFEELYSGRDLVELRDEAKRTKALLTKKYVDYKTSEITAQLGDVDEATEKALLEQVNHLNTLLRH